MVTILRKQNWILNPNDKVVNSILKSLERNNGECPCVNNSVDKHCPCTDYRDNDICHCGLYLNIVNRNYNKNKGKNIYVGNPDCIEGD